MYLVEEEGTRKLYAMKKIRCVFGGESVASAMREVNSCNLFKYSPLVISCIDSQVVQEQDGTKTVLILLPYYANGSLQDRITDNMINDSSFNEKEVIQYGLGAARAIAVMHHYRDTNSSNDDDDATAVHSNNNLSSNNSNSNSNRGKQKQKRKQKQKQRNEEEVGLLADYDLRLGELVPYAHRDIKPANIMFDDNDELILMDLGSCSKARVDVTSRQQAVELQDIASEHCTLPYRAPELFDVRTGSKLNEKVDVWGYGCTLYTIMYSASPFEREEQVMGANINIAITRGKFSFPSSPYYSDQLKNVVTKCLQIDPAARPTIDEVIEMLEALQ